MSPARRWRLASIAHGDSQINTGSTSGAILGAMAGGLDLAFIAGLVNKLTGTIVAAPDIRRPADLKGKTIGVTSIGGGNWVFTMLALEHWSLDPKRDNISIRVIGSDAVRAQAITTGTIDATQLSTYSYATALKRQGYRDLGRAAGPGDSVSRDDGLRPAQLRQPVSGGRGEGIDRPSSRRSPLSGSPGE